MNFPQDTGFRGAGMTLRSCRKNRDNQLCSGGSIRDDKHTSTYMLKLEMATASGELEAACLILGDKV